MPIPSRLLLETIAALAAAAPSTAEPLPLSRLDGRITVDGIPDEPAWQTIPSLPMIGFAPNPGAEPSEPTLIRLAYDEHYLYVAAELGIRDGGSPAVNTFTRDRWSNDDLIEVVIDSYNDKATAFIFGVNPAGNRIDAQVTNDGEATFGFPVDHSWNAFWDAAARGGPGGWSVEMRIPFSSLRFQTQDGTVTMGIIVSRFTARTNETVTFPAIDPRWRLGYNKPSQAREITFEGIRPTRAIHLSPYVLAGAQWSTGPGAGRAAARSVREAGADVRFAPAANLNLDMTFNTDFAQVEADDEQVNLTRFDLFLPEKRQFFLERASLFDVRPGRTSRLFHSRRIGINGTDRVRIVGGGRAVGRFGGWDVGALAMRTASSPLHAAETFAVGRMRMRALNDASYVGAMLTARSGGTVSGTSWAADLLLRPDPRRVLSATLAGSGGPGAEGGSALLLSLEDANRDGIGYRLVLSQATPGFDPPIGFAPRTDFREVDGRLGWGAVPVATSRIARWGPFVEGSYLMRHETGRFESGHVTAGGEIELRSGAMLRGGAVRTVEHLDVVFVVHDDVSVPAGRHTFTWARMFATTAAAPALATSVFARVGGYYDGSLMSVTLSPRLRMAPYLEVRTDLESFRMTRPSPQRPFTGEVIRLRGRVSLNTALSADVLLQRTSAPRRSGANVRLHYHVREGTSVWIALNHSQANVTPPDAADAGPARATDRAVVVKFIRTFGPT